jgi:hypothetical protein
MVVHLANQTRTDNLQLAQTALELRSSNVP